MNEREREAHRLQQARWAKANPECIADAQRKWREKQDRALFRKYDAKRYLLNPEERKAKSRDYYERNRKRINARRRAKSATARAEREALRKPKNLIGPAILKLEGV